MTTTIKTLDCECTGHNATSILAKKLDGNELRECEISWFIKNIVCGHIEACQIGAFTAAIFTKGMNNQEIAFLTKSMAFSGSRLHWHFDKMNTIVDKHSTGGIGDKVSLVLAPVLAACGLHVPSIAGRGLGITGGTIDKLEAIPNIQFEYSATEIEELTMNTGFCIVSQSNEIDPADKIIYAIRDVTSTVANIPLITSSIISKKFCETLSSLLLDVKCGKAAFMNSIEDARLLGKSLQNVGNLLGVKTTVIITQMDVPIGLSIGNAVEVVESIETLKGHGHPDLVDIVKVFASHLLLSTASVSTEEEGIAKTNEVINNGLALKKFLTMLSNQGVDHETVDKLQTGKYTQVFGESKYTYHVKAGKSGFIKYIDALVLGKIVQAIGGGRFRKDDKLDYQAGIYLRRHVGDHVLEGEEWCTVYHNISLDKFNFVEDIKNSIIIQNEHVTMKRILEIL